MFLPSFESLLLLYEVLTVHQQQHPFVFLPLTMAPSLSLPHGPLLTLCSPSFLSSFFLPFLITHSLFLFPSQPSLIEHPLLFTNRHPTYSTLLLPLFDIPSSQKCDSIITLPPPLVPSTLCSKLHTLIQQISLCLLHAIDIPLYCIYHCPFPFSSYLFFQFAPLPLLSSS